MSIPTALDIPCLSALAMRAESPTAPHPLPTSISISRPARSAETQHEDFGCGKCGFQWCNGGCDESPPPKKQQRHARARAHFHQFAIPPAAAGVPFFSARNGLPMDFPGAPGRLRNTTDRIPGSANAGDELDLPRPDGDAGGGVSTGTPDAMGPLRDDDDEEDNDDDDVICHKCQQRDCRGDCDKENVDPEESH